LALFVVFLLYKHDQDHTRKALVQNLLITSKSLHLALLVAKVVLVTKLPFFDTHVGTTMFAHNIVALVMHMQDVAIPILTNTS
jgi:hypothetical protein